MKTWSFILVFLTLFPIIEINGTFIDHYINPYVRPYCQELQEKLEFRYSFRVRESKNKLNHYVYLFTEDRVFSMKAPTAGLNWKEMDDFVLTELFFYGTEVKPLTEFWENMYSTQSTGYVTAFSVPQSYNYGYFVSKEEYICVELNIKQMKAKAIKNTTLLTKSDFGFFRNNKIKAKGFENIFGIDIAETWSANIFIPTRVYVRDMNNSEKAISFAFYNTTEETEEFENGKHYDYSFDSAAYLSYARSLANPNPVKNDYNHYFELRTRKGRFSLFDFTNNRDFLLIGSNEELLGCPPSPCHWREFDDIIRLPNNTKLLVYKEWLWDFTRVGNRLIYEEGVIANISSRQQTNENFKDNPFRFGIRHIVDGSFTDEKTLYIFRNGSFVSSKNDQILEELTPFNESTKISLVFKGVPSQTYDALFYHKTSRTVFFIKVDKYWAYSLATNTLLVEDKHIEYLGLPYDFKMRASYVEEDETGKQIEFYFFTENRFIILNEEKFESNRFRVDNNPIIYYCTSTNFLGCPDNQQFQCPPNPVVPQMTGSTLPEDKDQDLWNYLFILIAVIGALFVIILITIAFIWYKSYKQEKSRKRVQKKAENKDQNKPKSDTKGKESKESKNKTLGIGSSNSETQRSTKV